MTKLSINKWTQPWKPEGVSRGLWASVPSFSLSHPLLLLFCHLIFRAARMWKTPLRSPNFVCVIRERLLHRLCKAESICLLINILALVWLLGEIFFGENWAFFKVSCYLASCYIIFQVLKRIIELLPGEPAVKQVTLDFEKALWAAFRTILPALSIQGCVFHWTQAMWRKVRYRN